MHMQEDMTYMIGAASQADILLLDGRGPLRDAAQQAGTQASAAAAHAGTQYAEPLSPSSASSGSLSDSLPDMSFEDMLRRPASAPSTGVQTMTASLPLHPAFMPSATAMPVAAQTQYQSSMASLAVSSGQDAAAQTRQQALSQLPVAAPVARHAQDAAAQVPAWALNTSAHCPAAFIGFEYQCVLNIVLGSMPYVLLPTHSVSTGKSLSISNMMHSVSMVKIVSCLSY